MNNEKLTRDRGLETGVNLKTKTQNLKPKQNRSFCCIRAEPRKPAKLESDGMQGVKERPKEATLTTMQTTLYGCGLEGGDRPRAKRGGMPRIMNSE